MNAAELHCGSFLRESSSWSACTSVSGVDVASSVASCRADLMFTGDSRVAGLHEDRLRRECRAVLFRNASLWERQSAGKEKAASVWLPPRRIADQLCINNCTQNGVCERGEEYRHN